MYTWMTFLASILKVMKFFTMGNFVLEAKFNFLFFWEFISCPFDDKKQESGSELTVVGFWVDANKGSISLSLGLISDIQNCISKFLEHPSRILVSVRG